MGIDRRRVSKFDDFAKVLSSPYPPVKIDNYITNCLRVYDRSHRQNGQ